MSKVYKKITLVGTSSEGIGPAVKAAIKRASETLRHLDWFEIKEVRGRIENGDVAEFQVVLEVGFRLEGDEPAD